MSPLMVGTLSIRDAPIDGRYSEYTGCPIDGRHSEYTGCPH